MWWLLALGLALVACESSPAPPPAPSPTATVRGAFAGSDSNVFAGDYIGPSACGECHAVNFAKWAGSLHRVMNALVSDPGAVVGDFEDASLAYRDGTASFTHDASGYAMTLRRGATTLRYAVTRTIGRRGLQEYVGRLAGTGEEVRLPFGWWPRAGGWFAQPSFDPWLGDGHSFDPFTPVTEAWATRCPWCHSTYPFAARIPRDRGHGLDQLYGDGSKIADLGSAASSSPRSADRLDTTTQITVGISCESCHLGGRAHAAGAPIHLLPRGVVARPEAPAASTFAAERAEAAIVNATCAQCHSGPSPRLPDGTALRNSSEALDLAASPCTGIRCTDCHEPHGADARAPETEARAIAACSKCHAALADPAAARAHAGPHTPAQASCLDCHMPRIVLGIDRHVRTHRISAPTDARLFAAAAPNACNLCHLDRSLRWTAVALRDPWDVHVRLATEAIDDTPAGEAWIGSREPAYRLIAAAAFARSPDRAPDPAALARLAEDPLPYVRAWARLLSPPR